MAWLAPIPDPDLSFERQGGVMLLAQCILGEAEGEPFKGKLAVGHVVMNRVLDDRWPSSIAAVVLQPKQFSAFNTGSPRLGPMRFPYSHVRESVWNQCFEAACRVVFGPSIDSTEGANHYCSQRVSPRWADPAKLTVTIGAHRFYRV